MFIKTLSKEFIFDCQVRDLAPRTIRNYEKQLGYFVRYLEEAQGVISLEDLKPIHIKQYIAMLQSKNHKPSYINDLLKAVKVISMKHYNLQANESVLYQGEVSIEKRNGKRV